MSLARTSPDDGHVPVDVDDMFVEVELGLALYPCCFRLLTTATTLPCESDVDADTSLSSLLKYFRWSSHSMAADPHQHIKSLEYLQKNYFVPFCTGCKFLTVCKKSQKINYGESHSKRYRGG